MKLGVLGRGDARNSPFLLKTCAGSTAAALATLAALAALAALAKLVDHADQALTSGR